MTTTVQTKRSSIALWENRKNDGLVDVVYVNRDDKPDDEAVRTDHALTIVDYTWKGA